MAVLPSRPLNCSPPPSLKRGAFNFASSQVYFHHAEFAFALVRVHAEWRTTFAAEVVNFQKCRCQQVKSNRSIRFKQNGFSVLPPRGGELFINSNTVDNTRKKECYQQFSVNPHCERVEKRREYLDSDREGVSADRERVLIDREGVKLRHEPVNSLRESISIDREGLGMCRERVGSRRECL